MSAKHGADSIEKLLEDSDKAELLETLADVLDTPGHRMVVITGVPNVDGKGLSILVNQSGFNYVFEELGFMQEGFGILETNSSEDDDG